MRGLHLGERLLELACEDLHDVFDTLALLLDFLDALHLDHLLLGAAAPLEHQFDVALGVVVGLEREVVLELQQTQVRTALAVPEQPQQETPRLFGGLEEETAPEDVAEPLLRGVAALSFPPLVLV